MSSASDAELLVALQKAHHCNACQAPCYVLANGDHYHYDDVDLNLWVTLMVWFCFVRSLSLHVDMIQQSQHKATISQPPDTILSRLGEKSARQKAQSRRSTALAPSTPTTPTPVTPTPDPVQQMMVMMGAMTPLIAGMFHAGRDHSPTRHTSSKRHREAESSPAAPASSPSKAPPSQNVELDQWLSQVDAHSERGKRNANYAQYQYALAKKGIFDLDDLVRLTDDQLAEFTGLELGFRERLFRFAREDLGIKAPKHQRTN